MTGAALATVVAVGSQVSGLPLQPDSDLIVLGVDSVVMVNFATRLTTELGVTCDLDDVLDCASLTELAAILDGRR